jgi:hypothetical protein
VCVERSVPQVSRHITRYPTQTPARGHDGPNTHIQTTSTYARQKTPTRAARHAWHKAVNVRIEGVRCRPPGFLDTNPSSTQTPVDGPTHDVDEDDGHEWTGKQNARQSA